MSNYQQKYQKYQWRYTLTKFVGGNPHNAKFLDEIYKKYIGFVGGAATTVPIPQTDEPTGQQFIQLFTSDQFISYYINSVWQSEGKYGWGTRDISGTQTQSWAYCPIFSMTYHSIYPGEVPPPIVSPTQYGLWWILMLKYGGSEFFADLSRFFTEHPQITEIIKDRSNYDKPTHLRQRHQNSILRLIEHEAPELYRILSTIVMAVLEIRQADRQSAH